MSSENPQPSGSFDASNLGDDLEDRGQSRVRVDLAVTVDSEHNFYAGHVRDLSAGGVFVATTIVHAVGTRFNLSVHLDDGIDRAVRGLGEVRWIRMRRRGSEEPAGLGIRFLELEDDGRERVTRFLTRRDPLRLQDASPDSSPL